MSPVSVLATTFIILFYEVWRLTWYTGGGANAGYGGGGGRSFQLHPNLSTHLVY